MTRGMGWVTWLGALVLFGCRPAGPATEEAAAPPASEPAPPPPLPPPVASPADTVADSPIPPREPEPRRYATETPAEIPREALFYRDNFIRIWRYYFNLAESPTFGFAQVHQESRWNTNAKSRFASGLAQFTPGTAADFSKLLPPEVQAICPSKTGCPTEPNWALNALSLYDFRLHKSFGWAASDDDRWRLALAAYNGGAGWLQKERARAGGSAKWADIVAACMRAPQYCKENRDYPVRILEKWFPLYQRWLGI